LDEMSAYFRKEYEPKILITTSDNPHTRTIQFCRELKQSIPNAEFRWRNRARVKKVIDQAIPRGYSDIIVVNEDRRNPNGILLIHLPDGPTTYFKLTSLKLRKEIAKKAPYSEHRPEVILNNFNTRLGHSVGRMLASLFHYDPEFKGRRVVTFHNQRDFIFFRHHRYEFEDGKRVNIQEIGPRFTLKLKSLQKGTFDSKFGEASGHFCEAFKNFDEGRFADEADESLKLWVFSSLLSGSPVNPFDDQRASVYLSKTPIKNIERLVKSCTTKNIDQFLKDKRSCLRDPTVARFVPALERKVQKAVIIDLVQPYSNISLPFIAKKIMSTEEETENLLVEMILDNLVGGRIDQTAAILHLRPPQIAQDDYYEGVRHVSSTVAKLQNTVLQAVS